MKNKMLQKMEDEIRDLEARLKDYDRIMKERDTIKTRYEELRNMYDGVSKLYGSCDSPSINKENFKKVRVTEKMPQSIRKKYNMKTGDIYLDVKNIEIIHHLTGSCVYRWKRHGYIEEV